MTRMILLKDTARRAETSSSPLADHARTFLLGLCLFVVLPSGLGMVAASDTRARSFESFTKPYRVIEVAAAEPGRVANVSVQRGDTVVAGQTLLQMDSAILEATRTVVAAQAAGKARIDGLKVEHDLQLRRLDQFESLAKDGLGSSEELYRARADEQIALANLREAQELKEQQQLKVAEIEARIAARRVVSPIDGVLTDVSKEPGEFVSAAAPEVATIVDLSRLRASFFLPTELARVLSAGQPARVLLVGSQQVADGTIEHVSAVTDAQSGSVRVDVVIENQDQRWRSGIRCRLLTRP